MMKYLVFLALLMFNFSSFTQTTHELSIQSKMDGTLLLDGGGATNFWGFSLYTGPIPDESIDITLPGPILRFNEGDSVRITFRNNSAEDHTIHWHGLDVDQDNDGVPTTSSAVTSDNERIYAFKCTNAGTYNYHCHVLTTLHLSMGMYGQFIVDPDPSRTRIYTGGPTYTLEHNWLASEMDLNWNNNPTSPGLFVLYTPSYFMINGKSGEQLHDGSFDVVANLDDTVALRLSNMSYGMVRYVFPEAVNAGAYMSDGRALPSPLMSDTIDIYSGERYTVLLDPEAYINDSIRVYYTDVRTNEVVGYNAIPLEIRADASVSKLNSALPLEIIGNPTQNFLTIKADLNSNKTYLLKNSMGQTVDEFDILNGINIFEINLSGGTYYLIDQEGNESYPVVIL